MADLEQILILVIGVLLLALFLFIGDKLFGNKPVKLSSSYYLTAIITAVVIFAIIIGVSAAVGELDSSTQVGIGNIVTILSFVISCYAIKIILMDSATYERAVWVGVVAWTLVYVADYIAREISNGDTELIPYI
ncbi:MAG: hypothetical protein HeimC2_04750 [Candidatus Heimdallarchaeota archaeon LC_2]|nr:MAG: hypothetical protein HeimC2_04750 [Candidatus Heimdallarchaeota archaeon LC_2]